MRTARSTRGLDTPTAQHSGGDYARSVHLQISRDLHPHAFPKLCMCSRSRNFAILHTVDQRVWVLSTRQSSRRFKNALF